MPLHALRPLAAAVAAAVVTGFVTITPVAAATTTLPPHDLVHPWINQQAAADSAQLPPAVSGPAFTKPAPLAARPNAVSPSSSGPRREVFGFVNAGNLGSSAVGYTTWNLDLLSTVAYFGVHVNSGDGNLVTSDTGWAVLNSGTMSAFVSAAHGHGTRVVMTIQLFDFGAGTPQMCSGLTHTGSTISQSVQQMNAHGLDGINIDYEGLNGSCGTPDPSWARHGLTSFAQNLRAAMPAGSYLSIDSYAASAGDPYNFFDVVELAKSVDSFFIMAYDSDWSNYSGPPTYCSRYCLNPVSPLSAYTYNDTRAAGEYASAVPASKVILGLPYYNRGACVNSTAPNQYPAGGLWTLTYRGGISMPSDPDNTNFASHRDSYDGVSPWSTWNSGHPACLEQMYWDDIGSLGAKYDLVNRDNLRGVGLFTLDYGGGASELWSTLATHFSLIPGAPAALVPCAGASSASISWSPSPSSAGVSSYTVTASPGGATVSVPGTTTFATLGGLTPGSSYTLTVQGVNQYGNGVTSVPSDAITVAQSVQTSRFSWYDTASPGMLADNVHLVNPGSTASSGCVRLGGSLYRFSLAPQQGTHLSLGQGQIGGPIEVTVASGPSVIASQRVQYYQTFNETPATPLALASNTVYFPWFDRISSPGFQADNIHVINPGPADASVTVTIPGQPGCSPSATLQPGAEQYFTCARGFGGPVVVQSSGNPVIASQRVQYYRSFNETRGLPALAAGTSLYFSWYDNLSSPGFLNDNIHLVNPGASDAHATVTIPNCGAIARTVPAHGESAPVSCAGFGGPVVVTSDQPVLASQRVQYYQTFNEVSAVRASDAATALYMSWFDRLSSPGFQADNVHVVNPQTTTAHVSVSIPGCAPFSGTVGPNGASYFTCPAGFGGPVAVTADVAVVASQRVQFYQSFNEVVAVSPDG